MSHPLLKMPSSTMAPSPLLSGRHLFLLHIQPGRLPLTRYKSHQFLAILLNPCCITPTSLIIWYPQLSRRAPSLPQQQPMPLLLLHSPWPCPTTFAAVCIRPPCCPSLKSRPTSVCSLTASHSQLPLYLSYALAPCLPYCRRHLYIALSHKHTLRCRGLHAACTNVVPVPSVGPLNQLGSCTGPPFMPFFTVSPSWHIRHPCVCPPFPSDCSSRSRRRCRFAVVRPTQFYLSSLIVFPCSGPPLLHSIKPSPPPPTALNDNSSCGEHRPPPITQHWRLAGREGKCGSQLP